MQSIIDHRGYRGVVCMTPYLAWSPPLPMATPVLLPLPFKLLTPELPASIPPWNGAGDRATRASRASGAPGAGRITDLCVAEDKILHETGLRERSRGTEADKIKAPNNCHPLHIHSAASQSLLLITRLQKSILLIEFKWNAQDTPGMISSRHIKSRATAARVALAKPLRAAAAVGRNNSHSVCSFADHVGRPAACNRHRPLRILWIDKINLYSSR